MSTDTIFMEDGSPTSVIDRTHCRAFVRELLTSIRERLGVIRRALIVPPDITRFYSYAGELTGMLFEELEAEADIGILPALGTHLPMTPDEIDPPFEGDLRLIDSETGRPVEITADFDLLDRYRDNLQRWFEEIGQFCNRRGIVYARVDTSTPFERLIFSMLQQRGVLG